MEAASAFQTVLLVRLMEAMKTKIFSAHRRKSTAFSILAIGVVLSLYVILWLTRTVTSTTENLDNESLSSRPAVSCQDKHIYMYDNMPPEFNTDLLIPFCNGEVETFDYLCENMANGGLGPPMMQGQELPALEDLVLFTPRRSEALGRMAQNISFYQTLWNASKKALVPAKAWFNTHQFALELLFHSRMKVHPCLTTDPSQAALFYFPFYAALDATRHLSSHWMQIRDRLSNRLIGWLSAQDPWRKHPERHILVLGRIVWDFSRVEASDQWGNSLLRLPELRPAMKLTIERNTKQIEAGSSYSFRQMAVPYPTSFHPSSDLELREWLTAVAASRRDVLVSFVGARRPANSNAGVLRDRIFQECSAESRCVLLDCADLACSHNPRFLLALTLRSTFCLQPEGDSPTRRAIFDALITGCIPVFFSPESAYEQYLWHLPPNSSAWSVLVPADDARLLVVPLLAAIPESRVRSLRQAVLELIPGLVYAMPGQEHLRSFSDAIDIAIAGALRNARLDSGTML